MGKVYRARVVGAAGFEKTVALKFMLPRRSGSGDALRMFQEEARLAAGLSHANIVGILDFGVRGGNWYLAMEYVEGVNLRTLLERAPEVPPPLAAFIAAGIARGLQYAHARAAPDGTPLGIVHRDVSPQNIVVSWQGEVKILDFGIALARNRAGDESGVVRGKFPYMSPEQALGEPLDFRSDLFSLGSVFYEMLTGQKAFPQPGMKAALAVSAGDFLPPDRVHRDLPTKLVSIVLRAMAKDPFDRYLSAGEMLNELTQWIAEQRTRGTKERDAAREDEQQMLAQWVARACGRESGTGGARLDLTFSSDALSEDSTRSGEDEWKPPPRTAILGPGPRAPRLEPASGSRIVATPAPRDRRLAVGGAAALAVAGLAGASLLLFHRGPSGATAARSPIDTPTPALTAAPPAAAHSPRATGTATPEAVESSLALAASPSPGASPAASPAMRHIGLLEVASVPPGAMVYLDGQAVSEAPALIPDLAVPRRYSITVKQDGFADWGREVDLADDNRVSLLAKLVRPADPIDRGHVTVTLADGIEVVVDGKSMGTGPATISFDGDPGLHQVHLHDRTGKLVKEFSLEIRAKETTILSLPGG